MRTRKIILLALALSLAVSALVVLIIFYVMRNVENETARGRVYEEVMGKAHALSLSITSLRSRPEAGAIRQIQAIRGSLENLLGAMTSSNACQEVLIRQIGKNYQNLENFLDKLIAVSPAPQDAMRAERDAVLVSQLLMKNQFISEDTQRLIEISRSRNAAAQRNAGILAIALIFGLILTNAAILIFTGRSIIRMQQGLRLALAKAEEGDRMLSALMEYVPEGITMADAGLNLVRVSRFGEELVGGRHAGLSAAEVAARWKVYHADGQTPMADEDLPLVRAVKNGEIVKNAELQQVNIDGERLPLLCTAGPIRNAAGTIIGGIVAWRDIRERKQAEDMFRRYNQQLAAEVKTRTAEIQQQYRQLESLNQLIKQMAEHTLKAMENDRKALSKEIHDSIGGSLAAIKLLLETRLHRLDQVPPEIILFLEKIIGHITDTIREARRISYHMRPLALDDLGLAAALSEQFHHFKEFYPKIDIVSRIDLSSDAISDDSKTVLYRVVQEAMNNIGKHSGADCAIIEISESHDRISLKIEDNGSGFDVSKILDLNQTLQGYGMHSMKERIEICKGTLQVNSEPGKGTLLLASIPKTGANSPGAAT
ncbi:MAG: ATP-binding protein [Desulfobacterales bacterium]